MLQAEVICCRSLDGDFLLVKFGKGLVAREVRLGFARCRSSSEDYPSKKSGFMRNLMEGQPTVDLGWRWGGSADTGGDRPL